MNDEHDNETGDAENMIAEAIDAAEDIADPLDGLVARSAADPGAAFTPEVLERLAALKKDDRAAFEALRCAAQEGGLPRHRARRGHRRGKRGYWRARTDAGRHPDRPRADRRTVPRAGRHRLRRSRHQRPSRDLANPSKGLPPLAGAPLLRGDRRRAEFGGAAIGAERDRGQGAFRCAGARRPCPRRRAGRQALPRSLRRDMAGGRDRRHWLAGDRQSAGPLPPRLRACSLYRSRQRGGSIDALRSFPQRQVRR